MDMEALSLKLDECAALLEGDVVYLDYPVHDNVGDMLIWMGAQELLKRNNISLLGLYSFKLGYLAHKTLSKCNTICLHGGGNFGDLYSYHQDFRESIIQRYPDKKIVIFPQSIHYRDEKKLDNTCKILRSHKNLHICLRDKNSYAILKNKDIPNLYFAPDTAHALWGTLPILPDEKDSVLYLLRKDKEKAGLPQKIQALQEQSVDWVDLLKGTKKLTYQFGLQLSRVDGRLLGNMLPAYTIWNWEAKRLIQHAIDLFTPHETIVTNRLHAMILAALMEKKCEVYDNSYGKLFSYHDLWLSEIDNISFLESSK